MHKINKSILWISTVKNERNRNCKYNQAKRKENLKKKQEFKPLIKRFSESLEKDNEDFVVYSFFFTATDSHRCYATKRRGEMLECCRESRDQDPIEARATIFENIKNKSSPKLGKKENKNVKMVGHHREKKTTMF